MLCVNHIQFTGGSYQSSLREMQRLRHYIISHQGQRLPGLSWATVFHSNLEKLEQHSHGLGMERKWREGRLTVCTAELADLYSSFPFRLKFKFKRGSVPPTMPLDFVGCIGGCDQMLKELLDLRYSNRSSQSGQSASQQANQLQVNNSFNRGNSENRRVGGTTNMATGHLLYLSSTRAPRPAPSAAPDDGNNAVVCNCGNEAMLLTVRKEGPNQGRQFYKCSANTCNFFLWSDQQSEDRSNAAPRGSAPPRAFGARGPANSQRPGGKRRPEHFGSSNNSSSGDSTVCRCDQPAVTRTVQKDGPNKGRQFHTCSKPREQQCGFFQWADENVAPGKAGLGVKCKGWRLLFKLN